MTEDNKPAEDIAPFTEEAVAALSNLLRKVMYPSGKDNVGQRYEDRSGNKYVIGKNGNHIRLPKEEK